MPVTHFRFSLAVILSCAVSSHAVGQADDDVLYFSRGKTTENVVSGTNPVHRYAVYLPSTYETDKTAPALLLMDPRGRALLPLELFRDAADRYGFVILSSYNTLSDTDSAYTVNDAALSAMLVDAQVRFSVDPDRFYLVGFSGTAHYSWTISPQLAGSLAGIMGVGGGLPAASEPVQRAIKVDPPFVFFGTAGLADFNFDGQRFLDQSLDDTDIAHRLMIHDGDHSWPPKHIAESAVEWFHLQAMRTGSIEKDETFIEATRKKYLMEAAALEASGQRTAAYRRYREISQDFTSLGGAAEAVERFEALERDRSVGRAMAHRAEVAQEVIKYKLRVRKFYLEYRNTEKLPSLEEALKKLQIERLKKQTRESDVERSSAAKRMLATAFVNTGFYEPRDYFNKKDYVRAAGLLRIASAINPDVPRICYQLARATTQLGELDEALEALQCGRNAEWATDELIESDELLAPLRSDERYSKRGS